MFGDLKNKFRREGDADPNLEEIAKTEGEDVLEKAAETETAAEAVEEVLPESGYSVSQDVVLPAENHEISADAQLKQDADQEEAVPGEASQLSFNEQVVERIATLALHEVKGVLAASGGGGFFNLKNSKGVEIEINPEQDVTVNMEVILEYGRSAPEIFEELKRTVSEQIRGMTGLLVRAVNVRVVNILTKEEFEGKA